MRGRAMRDKFNRAIKPNKDRKPEAEAVAPQAETFSPSSSPFIRASARKPGTAMLGVASVMFATNAMAQEALPTIDVQENAGTGAIRPRNRRSRDRRCRC